MTIKSIMLGIVGGMLIVGTAASQSCGPNSRCVVNVPLNCKVDFETLYPVDGCDVSVIARWEGTSAPIRSDSCIANPPRGTYIWSAKRRVNSSNNGSGSLSKIEGGLKYDYKEEIDEAYKEALEVTGKIVDDKKKKEIQAKINAAWETHKKAWQSVSTNKDTVRLTVTAQGDGWVGDRKRGWEDNSVDLMVRCIAPVNLNEQILKQYGLDKTLEGLSKDFIITNDSNNKYYIFTKAVDMFTECSAQSGDINISVTRKQQDFETVMDPKLSMCYVISKKSRPPSIMNDTCRGSAGDEIKLSQIKKDCFID